MAARRPPRPDDEEAGGPSPSLPAPTPADEDSYAAQLRLQRMMTCRRLAPNRQGTFDDARDAIRGYRRRESELSQVEEEEAAAAAELLPPAAGTETEARDRALRALRALHNRGSCTALDASDLFEGDKGEGGGEKDGHGHGHDGHGASHTDNLLPWYSPPVQRQLWGAEHVLPHVNWGDLFFDLFYVAAAYNMGVQLMGDVSGDHGWLRGIIYFVGAFGTLWRMWEQSMHHEARYTSVDYAHRFFEVVRYLFVATAVLHVKPMELQMDPKSAETLLFSGAALCEGFMQLLLCIELYCKGLGDREAIKNHTRGKIWRFVPTLAFYLAALVVAVLLYVRPEEKEGGLDAGEYDAHGSDEYDGGNDKYENWTVSSDGSGRLLAPAPAAGKYDSKADSEPAALWTLSDLPMTLMAIAYLETIVVTTWTTMAIAHGKRATIKDRYVWPNIDYMIHRYGEWILLMIGEGILSLLVVETVESTDYLVITTFGTLTIIFVQMLTFEGQPHHTEDHALWRNLHSSMCYGHLMQVLSMSLIVFGASYKVFLKAVLYSMKDNGYGKSGGRMLAPASYSSSSNEAPANYYCYSIGLVLLALELIGLTHTGFERALGHLVLTPNGGQHGEAARPHWPVVVIALLKLALILFAVTLAQWTTDPTVLTLCGCAVVLSLIVTRVANFFWIHKKEWLAEHVREISENICTNARKPTVVLQGMFDDKGSNKVVHENKVDSTGRSSGLANSAKSSDLHGTSWDPLNNPEDDWSENSGEDKANSVSQQQRAVSFKMDSNEPTPASNVTEQAMEKVVVNHALDGIIAANDIGVIQRVNSTAVTQLGYSSEDEIIGKNFSALLIHGNSAQTLFMNTGGHSLLKFARKDGTTIVAIVTSTNIEGISNAFALYIRNLDPFMNSIKQEMMCEGKVE